MAKFKTQCPLCQAEIHVHSQWAGQQAVCPSCGEAIMIPMPPQGELPHITTCPACNATQSIPAEITGRVKRNCSKCGTSYLFIPDISFPSARRLPPDRNGNPRIACPRCERHYVIKYTPENGLIGCQECMTIFAHPDMEDQQSSNRQRPVLLPPTLSKPAAIAPPSAPTVSLSNSAPAAAPRPVLRAVQAKQNNEAAAFLNDPVHTNPGAVPENQQYSPASPKISADEEMVSITHRSRENTQNNRSSAQQQSTDSKKSLLKKFFSN